MGFVDKWPSRMLGQWFFSKLDGHAVVFGQIQKNVGFWARRLPLPEYFSPEKFVGGGFNVLPHKSLPIY